MPKISLIKIIIKHKTRKEVMLSHSPKEEEEEDEEDCCLFILTV